ncbi:MAG TPA: glycoside hydrolase family 38 C-terminal domain-containing protein [Candidatus Rubrimentiphilum sp.]|nr:glycoside hydrolase family 38 C-terminal domain-containing protein [Candidatus Rubrimentiphilum sp.]
MKLPLAEASRSEEVVRLRAVLPASAQPALVSYRSRTGALLRVDGIAAGAYDREHHDVFVPACDESRELELEVELEALPTNGLPSGPGIMWWFLNALSHQRPQRFVDVTSGADWCHGERAPLGAPVEPRPSEDEGREIPLIGHSHLDVAWLWTYEQTRRKAQRTFAIACDLFERDPQFVFAQSQPQLYRFVEENDPQLFEHVRDEVHAGRFDPDVAALWVESDCNLPSGESLLRQMLFAHEYCTERLGVTPAIAWLPDSFGFANTLPQLLAHAGIPFFATTKLQWNDTTRFPYPQFVWRGPDGSSVTAALIQSYDGGPYPWRVKTARERHEPLVLGYGDGGGGVTPKMLAQAPAIGRWIRPRDWFERLANPLPVYTGELYLEYHRGTYTTHHDIKFQNALLERALLEAEELVAWCEAVRAPAAATAQFAQRLRAAWEIVLRNQFHDVLPGTATAEVYRDAESEYAQAQELVASAIASAESMLPRTGTRSAAALCAPQEDGGSFVFGNGLIRARVGADGAITELAADGGRNVAIEANVLALYRDRPRQWDAWNIDDGYQQTMRRISAARARIAGGALELEYDFEGSPGMMRVELRDGEPFLRVELDVEWHARRRLLRVENRFAVETGEVTYGAPHGTIVRSALRDTPEERAKFEVPGQRFAAVRGAGGDGAAFFALDTYGWSSLRQGSEIALGHSLLRGTVWPDPQADLGSHRFSYAFAPLISASTGALERAWLRFAHEPRVRLFTTGDENVLVVACKPAEDRNGAIVRVRECNGDAGPVRLRSGARLAAAHAVDALERPVEKTVSIENETLVFDVKAFELRSFRVRFGRA